MPKEEIRYWDKGVKHLTIVKRNEEGNDIWWKNKPLVSGIGVGFHMINRDDLPVHEDKYIDQEDVGKEQDWPNAQTGTVSFCSGANAYNVSSGAVVTAFPITPLGDDGLFDSEVSGNQLIVNAGTSGALAFVCISGSVLNR